MFDFISLRKDSIKYDNKYLIEENRRRKRKHFIGENLSKIPHAGNSHEVD